MPLVDVNLIWWDSTHVMNDKHVTWYGTIWASEEAKKILGGGQYELNNAKQQCNKTCERTFWIILRVPGYPPVIKRGNGQSTI